MRQIELIVVHRIDLSGVDWYSNTPASMRRFFKEHPDGIKATGGKFPYHDIITKFGYVVPMVPPYIETPHATDEWNHKSIAIACVGDYTKECASNELLSDIASRVSHYWNHFGPIPVRGHTDLPGGTHWRGHVCPGDGIDLSIVQEKAQKIFNAFSIFEKACEP